jgi:tetratricopeptide (TPR) repeat protein
LQVYDPHHEVAALLMNDIALCLNIQGNFSDAHDMLVEALALFDRPGATLLTQHACALAHNNLAVCLAAMGRPHEAQTHLRKALRGIKSINSPFLTPQPTLYLQAAILIHLRVCLHLRL